MSSSYTQTSTYTVADVRKVFDQMRADLRMAGQSSETMSTNKADDLIADILQYAEKGYVEKVLFRLVDSSGSTIKAAEYEITTSASSLVGSRSGNMMWPRTEGGYIATLVTTSAAFDALGPTGQDAFRRTLKSQWGTNAKNPSLSHLTANTDRSYVSNSYGATKKSYS